MNPFTDRSPCRSPWMRPWAQPTVVVFILCLAGGLGWVAWRATVHSNTAHALARAEAGARAAALEAQLNQTAAAVEVLGALARQSRGAVPDFQRVAAEVMNRHPGLSSLELQPGGMVTEIVPRAGNERALGVNVLRDASQGAGANEAIARRALTVSGPVRLYRGEQGIVARVPVFQRAADGRESFWGFVAGSMRLQEALTWAQVNQLPRWGYNFAFFVPGSSRQKGVLITANSSASLQDAEQQPVHVQDVEFRLAVKPRAGWVDKVGVICGTVLALLFASVAAFLASCWTTGRRLETELAGATERVAQEQAKRVEAETAQAEAKEELASIHAELERAQEGFKQATARAAQFERDLEASHGEQDAAARQHAAEQKQAHEALVKAQETIAQLQARLDAAAHAEQVAAAAAAERLQHHQTALSELRAKLEAGTRSAREEAKAKAAELGRLEQSYRDLQARLEKAEQAEARVDELEARLLEGQAELRQREALASEAAEAASREGAVEEEADASAADYTEFSDTDYEPEAEPTPLEVMPAESPEEELAAEPESAAATSVVEEPEPQSGELGAEEVPAELSATAEPPPTPPTVEEPPVEAPAPAKSASKPTRRRKASRDDQMDLFGGEARVPQAESKAPAIEAESEDSPTAEKAAASHRLPPAPPVDPAQLRKAVHQIVPLLADQDPGAKDCLRDNRTTFRSAFAPEAYVEFEQWVKGGDYSPALESLKKAARKHGIAV